MRAYNLAAWSPYKVIVGIEGILVSATIDVALLHVLAVLLTCYYNQPIHNLAQDLYQATYETTFASS